MHYVWQHRLLLQRHLITVDGEPVVVIDPGLHNNDAGPDFFNAKIQIGPKMWAGDVEMHVRASDWHRHGHDGNPAYDSVILHVVDSDDAQIKRSNGEVVPQMVMHCAPDFSRRYDELVGRSDIDLPCAYIIPTMPPLHLTSWLASLGFERLYEKASRMVALMESHPGDWDHAVYVTLARALGFGLNSEPMERLALSTPLAFLRKHSDSALAVEALLFGQGGFIDPECGVSVRGGDDAYVEQLTRQYAFLRHKFSLKPMISPGWKMARTRPQNLPQRRIALLAAFITGYFRPAARLLELKDPDEAVAFFRTPLTGYWANHYTLGGAPSESQCELISENMARVLVINVVAPLLMARGLAHDDNAMMTRATQWLEELAPERNSVVTAFTNSGIRVRNAFDSQAVLQLRREYCEKHKCIYCRLGHRILAARAHRE